MGGVDIIPPPKSPGCCVDGRVLEHKSSLVHQILRDSRYKQLSGRIKEQLTVSLIDWLTSLVNCMVRPH